MIDIQTMTWRGPASSFYHWFIAEIDALVQSKHVIKVGARERFISSKDFGFSNRTIRNWRVNKPANLPAPKKIKDIVNSIGFRAFDTVTRRQIILAWIGSGLHAKSEISENLIHLLKLLAENTHDDFLLKFAKEAFRFHHEPD